MSEMRIVLFGAGGYGDVYVQSLLKDRRRENYVLAGVVDPYIDPPPAGRRWSRRACLFSTRRRHFTGNIRRIWR